MPDPRSLSRRTLLRSSVLAAAGLGLAAACGSSGSAGSTSGASSSSSSPASTGSAAASGPAPATSATASAMSGGSGAAGSGGATSGASGAASVDGGTATALSGTASGFPVSITHKFGTTTVTTAPQRVLTLGYTDHEPLLALGIVPVGVQQWIPQWKSGVGPWSESLLKGQQPALFGYQLDFEKAAALKPDLIFIIGYDPDQKTYDTLSAIAPTIAPAKDVKPYGTGWEAMTTTVSTAVGRQADGRTLVADTKALLARTAAANPGLAGKTFAVIAPFSGKLSYYEKTDIRSQLLSDIGMTPNAFIAGHDPATFYSEISAENVGSLDADLVVVMSEETSLTKDGLLTSFPSLATVPAVKAGHLLVLNDLTTAMAFSSASVLSIPVALQAFVGPATTALAA